MKKINVAKLLKDCPQNMELDSPVWNNIVFEEIDGDSIVIVRKSVGAKVYLTQYGAINSIDGNCVIYPKGKTTWEGFVPPYKFKDGDVLYVDCADEESDGDLYKYIFILKEIDSLGNHFSYCHLYRDKLSLRSHYLFGNRYIPRFATEEEKAKLFKAIEDNSYKWNPETKILEKLIEPKFKVGDRITNGKTSITIDYIDNEYYYEIGRSIANRLFIKNQDEWELVPNKFDINTLKPFDRVLVRFTNNCVWMPKFFSYYDTSPKVKYYPFITTDNIGYPQCIPYEKNEYLSNTTEDCNEYYKTWK